MNPIIESSKDSDSNQGNWPLEGMPGIRQDGIFWEIINILFLLLGIIIAVMVIQCLHLVKVDQTICLGFVHFSIYVPFQQNVYLKTLKKYKEDSHNSMQ